VQQTTIPRAITRWGRIGDRQGDFPLPAGDLPQQFGRTRAAVSYYNTILDADYFLVDGVRCKPVGHPMKRGLRTQAVVEITFQRDD
jgi:hypothetical protein